MTDYPDYEGQKQRVYLMPEWAAKDAVDKDFFTQNDVAGYGAGLTINYAVPAGTPLYIVQAEVSCYASAAANANNNQMVLGQIIDNTTGDYLFQQTGNGGFSAMFNKPLVIPAGHAAVFQIFCMANHAAHVALGVHGYEV